jgi:N utilization substance protein A
LAIGRDGQNARLAAKLTGWRIDIKSLVEAAADAIVKVQKDPTLTKIAEAEHNNIPTVEAVLAKKVEGRPVTPEEFMTLIQFIERVERRTVEVKKATAAAEEERVSAARSEVPNGAFFVTLESLGLADRIYTILTAGGYQTAGDLMMALKLNPDRVLGLAGIGPKSIETIKSKLESTTYPEPEIPVEPVAVVTEPASVETGGVPGETAVETSEVVIPSELLPETVPAQVEASTVSPAGLDEIEGKPLEEIFTLKPDMLHPVATTTEEDDDESDKKKGKKKKKKVVEVVYDEDLDKTVAKIKHKRGDEGWEEE